MARGWESKSVESQIEAAEKDTVSSHSVPLTAEEIRRRRELESLELSRTRALLDLASATNPRYRDLMEQTVKHLDSRIATLKSTAV